MLRAILTLFLVLSLLFTAAAQKRETAKLVAIHAQGSTNNSEADIVVASGLHVGQTAGTSELKAAADKLAQTGAFESVAYSFQMQGTGLSVTFKVEDSRQWLNVGYSNFLWFSPQEINDAIRKEVPLFHGRVPLGGNMPEAISTALEHLIAMRGITGSVSFTPTANFNGPITGGVFKINDLDMKIVRVEVTGGGIEQQPMQAAASAQLTNTNFDQAEANSIAQLNLKPIALRGGFLKVQIGSAEAKLVDSDPVHPTVAVAIPVVPGEQYMVRSVDFSSKTQLAGEALMKAVRTKPGAVANDVQASDDVENIERVCQGAGYMEAQARLERDIDDTNHMVSYHYFVKEGEQYHMGKLAIEGVDAQGTQTLASRWKIKEGEPYSGDYVRDYLREVTRLLPRGATVTIKPQPDRRTKAVNVTLNFAPR